MSPARPTPSFDGWRAVIMHRPHANVDALIAQCARIGIEAIQVWPELKELTAIGEFHVILVDADMGYDGQFPWRAGEAPAPLIALIGSEAPGRIAWAISQRADAHLLKPIGSAGLYSTLVIASQTFARRRAMACEIASLNGRLAMRETLAQATALLMLAHNCSARDAYHRLRLMAMAERQTIEVVADRMLAESELSGAKNVGRGR
jgi:response regulator NasT